MPRAGLLSLPPLYKGGGPRTHINCSKLCAAPPPQFTPPVIFSRCLGEALHRPHHHHRQHAVVLTELIYSFDPLLDQELKGRHRAERVQNSEVPYVWYSISRIEKTFDFINRVKQTLPLSVYEGTWTHSPTLVAMHLPDRSCVSVEIFLKLHATFPNRKLPAVLLLVVVVVLPPVPLLLRSQFFMSGSAVVPLTYYHCVPFDRVE